MASGHKRQLGFVGSKLVLTHAGSLLTCLRDDVDWIPFPGHWDLPGGGSEPDETPVECALRELYEEFTLTLTPERLTAHVFPSWRHPERKAWLFTGIITPEEIAAIQFGDEGQEWRMMPVAEFVAHPLAVPHFRDNVRQVLGL